MVGSTYASCDTSNLSVVPGQVAEVCRTGDRESPGPVRPGIIGQVDDPFATAATRERVLAAWAASPARFREDANAEEDLALGGYRDRLVVELAQNAADAAARAGRPGRLRLTLRDDPQARAASGGPVLVAANTGAPLTADGVVALATLRASAKREDDAGAELGTGPGQVVGRFGVGFAAVLAVTDEPSILSRTGGVRFSREDTAALVADAARDVPDLAGELRRRGGHVPTLRLPFATEGAPPDGFDTAVVLPLRDEAAADLVRRLLAEADDALLLALPHLDRIEIDLDGDSAEVGRAHEARVLTDVGRRWHAHRAGGTWTPDERATLLADRPTEERYRPFWSVLWALPRTDSGSRVPGVVHAPTPTDEPLSLPAMLLASFPLDPTRRHVATGPLTSRLVEESATTYAELVRSRADAGDDVTSLVPVGLPSGRLDGEIRDAVLRRLPRTPMLRAVDGSALLRPSEAVVVDGIESWGDDALLDLLAPLLDGLVPYRRGDRAAFEAVGVRRLALDDLVDELATVADAHPPDWWQRLYVALAPGASDQAAREAMGALPVPLADGRVVRGARGLLLPSEEIPAAATAALSSYGLRLVHPDVLTGRAGDLLERLGAVRATARVLLEDGAVRAAVEDSADADDADSAAGGVLALVAAACVAGDLAPGDLPWLGDLALRDDDGELAPASALVVPGSEAEAILDEEEFAPVDGSLVDRWGEPALEAAGVLRTLGLVTASDVDLDTLPDVLTDLDDVDTWADDALAALSVPPVETGPAPFASAMGSGVAGEVTGVRDLEVVREEAWPRALRLFARDPGLRQALVRPVRVRDVGRTNGPGVEVPSYAAWWIRRHVRVDGTPLDAFADPDADPAVAAILAPAPAWLAELDPRVRAAVGVVRTIGDLDVRGVHRILDRLADPGIEVAATTMLALWAQFGALDPSATGGSPPEQVRVLAGLHTRVVDAAAAVVVDAPMWTQRTDLGRGQVLAAGTAAENLAELLDLPLASELAPGAVDEGGDSRPVPESVREVLPGLPTVWWEHEDLRVDGRSVDWWVDQKGRAHAATGEGLARALAFATDRWELRHALAALLAEPDQAAELLAESAYDPTADGD